MNKILLFFLALSFSLTACAQGDPSPFIKGQNATGLGNQASTVIVPYRQSTKINAYQALIETGNLNMLANGEFEGTASTVPSGWTCTTGTCTKTTSAGEFSSGLAAMKIVAASNVIDVSQAVSTTSGIQKQGFARVIYRVPNTCSTFKILTTVDSATQTTVPTANLVYDNTFRSIEVPLTFGSTNAGIKFTASTTCTGNIFVDGAILAQGLGLQNLQTDDTYSAKVSIAAVVSAENKEWITGNGSYSSGDTTLTFASGIFTVAPNCVVASATNSYSAGINTVSATQVVVRTKVADTGTDIQAAFNIFCQKSGNDYLAASSNVYSQASSGVHYISATATSSTFGSTNTSVPIFTITTNNNAGFLTVNSNATDGTSFVATRDLIINISGVCSAGTGGTCHISKNATTLVSSGAPGAGTSLMSGVVQSQSTAGDITIVGEFLITTGDVIRFQRNSTLGITGIGPMAITARPATNVIVGSFENVPTVPGAGARIDIFSVAYGDALNTACTSANGVVCPYIKTIGAGASVTHGAVLGGYNLIAPRTYVELQCQSGTEINNHVSTSMSCSNCNGHAFQVTNALTANGTNAYGNVSCIGTY